MKPLIEQDLIMKHTLFSSIFKFSTVPIASLQEVFQDRFQDYYSYAYSQCFDVQSSCDILTKLFLKANKNPKELIDLWKDKKSIYDQIDKEIKKLDQNKKKIALPQTTYLKNKRKAQLKRVITILTPKQKRVIITYDNKLTTRWYRAKKVHSFYCELGKILQLLDSLPVPQLKIKTHVEHL